MRGRGFWARLMTGAVVAAPLAMVAVAAPAEAVGATETSFSYVSSAGDYIGQGRTGALTDPAQFRISGTSGLVTVSIDAGSEWWSLDFSAPRGEQLGTGSYENISRARFNTTYGGLGVASSGRGCNQTKGRFTIYAISADTAGRITSLDASFTQFCDSSTGGLTGTVRYEAPVSAPPVLSSSNPSTVAGQPVTFTARVAQGAGGGVVFYDGSTPIGQGSFDPAGTARLETSTLGVGTHSITARVGTATSDAVTQVVAGGDTSLWFGSEYGDFIGQGATASYVPPTAAFTVRGTTADVSVSVDSPSTGQWWTVTVAAPPGETLQAGTYPGAVRAPFRGQGQPGLSVSGTGRGCNTLTGSFVISSIGAAADGTVTSLDATFQQFCGAETSSLHGRVRFNASPVEVRAATTTALSGGTTSDGGVPLTATVTSGSGVPTGQVTFREGATTLGSAVLDGSGRAFLLVSGLARGSHTLTADYAGSPAHQPSTGSTTVAVAGIATTTSATVSAKTVKAGKPLTVGVTVSAAGTAQPSGTVRLYDGVEPVATAATLLNGKATITWTPVAKGNRSLTVRYLGSETHAPSVSAATTVRVN